MITAKNNNPVFPLALGGAALGSCHDKVFFGKVIPEPLAIHTVLCALENGINLIDTSPFYGNSEMKIGAALREYGNRNSVILSTKAGTHPEWEGYTAEKFLQSIDSSLKALKTDYLDIVHIHDPSEDQFETVMGKDGGLEALLKLKEEGVIRCIGLGVRDHFLHRKFIESGYADVILPYLDYNLLRTSADELIRFAAARGANVLLGSPLCMGLLSGKHPRRVDISHFDISSELSVSKAEQLYKWCGEKDISVMALNYAFIRKNQGITAILAGAASSEQVMENLQAFAMEISPLITEEFENEFQVTVK